MSSRGKINVAGIFLALVVVAFYGVLQWQANPVPSIAAGTPTNDPDPEAEPTGDPPDEGDPDPPGGGSPTPVEASIVFVIDGSQHMYPRVGPNYFDLAKNAILEFLNMPGFMKDGRYEIGLVQFTEMGAPGYDEDVHWIPPTRVWGLAAFDLMKLKVGDIQRSTHHTADLLELGIREAGELLNTQTASTGQKHMIVLTTGEYRLPYIDITGDGRPDTCPPPLYSIDDASINDPLSTWSQDFDCDIDCRYECNRACPIRYHAWKAREQGITLSTIRLGYDWQDIEILYPACEYLEPDCPYRGDPPECEATPDYCPDGVGDYSQRFVQVPDRDGFLKELANWGPLIGQDRQKCVANQELGGNARIEPIVCADCEARGVKPGSAKIVADTFSQWLCDWIPTDSDGDFVRDLCDNCPSDANLDQRDCNRDGIGDACIFFTFCVGGPGDADGDGVCDKLDVCPEGDDCLVADWLELADCADLDDCDCDCDNNGEADLCQAAREIFDVTLTSTPGCLDDEALDCVVDGFAAHDADESGTADVCEFELCDVPDTCVDCNGVPRLCNALAKDDGAQITQLYLEEFTDYESGQPFVAQSDELQRGWWLDRPSSSNYVNIVEDTSSLANSSEPGIYGNVLELSLDTNNPTDGTASFFVEGPGMIIPPTIVANSCTQVNMDPGDWGIVSIKIDVLIDNRMGGPDYDLYILDPCADNLANAQRVHLRFRDDTTSLNDGRVYLETNRASSNCRPLVDEYRDIGRYSQGLWTQLHIRINSAEHFDHVDAGNPVWNGGGNSVRIDWNGGQASADCSESEPELGLLTPTRQRGVQLRISSSNRDCDCAAFGTDTGTGDEWTYRLLCPGPEPDANGVLVPPSCWCWDDDNPPDGVPNDGCVPCVDEVNGLDGLFSPALFHEWMDEHCIGGSAVGDDSWPGPGDPVPNVCLNPSETGIFSGCDIADCRDNCPNMRNPWQIDSDGDGWGDACDGHQKTYDSSDRDGVYGVFDNCVNDYNPRVAYVTADGICALDDWGMAVGTMWQRDKDCDGFGDVCDNCEFVFNPSQLDKDGDEIGDACEGGPNCTDCNCDPLLGCTDVGVIDADKDCIPDDGCDNCVGVYNPDQIDSDGDSWGNACDSCPYYADGSQVDRDEDGFGLNCDNCNQLFNPDQADRDRDGTGDACDNEDNDIDGDGETNGHDNCVYVPNGRSLGSCISGGDAELGNYCTTPGNNTPECGTKTDGTPGYCSMAQEDAGDESVAVALGNACDNCRTIENLDQKDENNNGIGDACEPTGPQIRPDNDHDGFLDGADNCYSIANGAIDPITSDLTIKRQFDGDRDGLGDACDDNTHITDCDADGLIDQWECATVGGCPELDGTMLEGSYFCNPCHDASCPNPGQCMCISPGYPFMLEPLPDDHWHPDTILPRIGGMDGGVCPSGPCDYPGTCNNRIRIGRVEISRTHRCEWWTENDCVNGAGVVGECQCGSPFWTCVFP